MGRDARRGAEALEGVVVFAEVHGGSIGRLGRGVQMQGLRWSSTFNSRVYDDVGRRGAETQRTRREEREIGGGEDHIKEYVQFILNQHLKTRLVIHELFKIGIFLFWGLGFGVAAGDGGVGEVEEAEGEVVFAFFFDIEGAFDGDEVGGVGGGGFVGAVDHDGVLDLRGEPKQQLRREGTRWGELGDFGGLAEGDHVAGEADAERPESLRTSGGRLPPCSGS